MKIWALRVYNSMSYQKKDRWTANQIDFLKQNYESLKDEEISAVVGRSLKSVRLKRQRMGLPKAHGYAVCRSKEEWIRVQLKRMKEEKVDVGNNRKSSS